MSERDSEALAPHGVLGVGNDAGASDSGAADAYSSIRVAGDDLRVVGAIDAIGGAPGEGEAAAAEATAKALGKEVHVGEVTGAYYVEVEVAVEEDGLVRCRIHRSRVGGDGDGDGNRDDEEKNSLEEKVKV